MSRLVLGAHLLSNCVVLLCASRGNEPALSRACSGRRLPHANPIGAPSRVTRCFWGMVLLGVTACAATPRPRALGEADAVRRSPAALEARQLSPQAVAHADQLASDAEQAFERGDLAGAQILSEQAIAAYYHSVAVARLVRAQHRLQAAEDAERLAQQALSRLDREQQRVAAEADQLELRARVARSSVPLAPTSPTTPEREQARREASRALGTEARLLCIATRLLDAKAPELDAHFAALNSMDQKLVDAKSAPIDEALRLRSACLHSLTLVRRAATLR